MESPDHHPDDTIIVAVTGVNASDNPGPGAGIARSLKEHTGLPVRVIGLAYDALEPGVFMDWVIDRCCIMPFPGGGRTYIDRLLALHEEFQFDLVIPSLDAELPIYIRYADELAERGIRTLLPSMTSFGLRGKDRLVDLAAAIGLHVPETRVVNNEIDLEVALNEIGFPAMLKGMYCGAETANTYAQAFTQFRRIAADWGHPVIVQQRIEGDELNLVGLGDGEGGLLGQFAMKKLTTTAQGKVWSAVSVSNPQMRAAAERFVSRFHWKGPFELECLRSGEELHLIELNPRFPAWVWFATAGGVNLPERLLRTAFGQPLDPAAEGESGRLFVRYTSEIVTDYTRFQSMLTRGMR